ncbi:hypothetical protein FA10DRAFT_154342 [Acaromyces ingoldii]|uniref:Histidine kinase/HSP90-like ATPase domain-containing protein n=1 Tax=Acaromyces ingoldii TaxID=215250 RepID=A0A316YFB1_9BASI|nr:hypothetical protein FA10DRAFT_154342 [Acaromyces ingoldii]PWN88097.1 hypothetical protein FA10DRAFT_154342 [Acaromyces ingoldii]
MLREKEARRAAYIEGSDLEEVEDEAYTPSRRKTENIERLSATTSALIRASSTFPSFSLIVAEVVRNALDAHNVKSVSAELTFAPEWQVRCEDDGEGFEEKAWPGMTWDKVLEVSTSATPPFIVGSSSARRSRQSLSQLAHLGTLDILTAVQGSQAKSRLLAQDDNIIFCGPHAAAASGSHRGSTVVVRNLFAKVGEEKKIAHDCSRSSDCLLSLAPCTPSGPGVSLCGSS